MKYAGPLYGKIGRRFVPLTMTSQQVDALESERDQLSRDLSSLLAADCLNGHDATEGAQNGIAMRKAIQKACADLDEYDLITAKATLEPFLPIPETTSLQS